MVDQEGPLAEGVMDYSLTVQAYGTDRFKYAILDLMSFADDDLIEIAPCPSGGHPSDFSPEEVISVSADDESIEALVAVAYSENVGAGCGEFPHSQPRSMDCQVTIDRRTGRAEFSHIERDVPDEF